MKTKISLLPPEIKSRRLADQKLNKILAVVTVAVLTVLVAYAALFITGIKLRADVRALQRSRAAVEAEVASLEEYAILHRELTAAEKTVNQALGTVPHWGDLLQEIGFVLPHSVWLTEIGAVYYGDSGEIRLRGWAYEHSDVAAFLKQIQTLQSLEEPRCQMAATSRSGEAEVVQFYIEARVAAGTPLFETAEGGD